MIEITFAQLQGWLALFLWPFTRITAFMMAAPLLGHTAMPARFKVGMGVLLTVAVAAILPPLPDVPLVSWAGLGIMVEQMLIGAAMGLCMQIVFAVVQMAGEFIGLQMGLGFASFFSPDTGANSMILSRWLYMVALLFFLAIDGHLFMIQVLGESFTTLPIGLAGLDASGFELLARFSSVLFMSGILLALPLVAALLIINLSLGILNRAAPQFTVFSVGFPMSLITGMFLLGVLITDYAAFLEPLFLEGLQFMQEMLLALAGGP